VTVFVGIDFGTTNTAVAVAGASGPSRLVSLGGPEGVTPTWRTILHFDDSGVTAGSYAIARYLAGDGEGRLVQSIKSHLASRSFTQTTIDGRTFTLERLVAAFLIELRRAAAVDLGNRAVVGRPVRYWGSAGDADDARAVERMTTALRGAGFDQVVFEPEPIAAAAAYAARLDHDELVLVADIGGGTSDFSLVRVGPGAAASASAVLATGGIAIGGDSFDAEIIDARIAPLLGKGSHYRDEMRARTPVPAWLFSRLRRWHQLSFLKSRATAQLLERIQTGALEPERIGNLVHVVNEDMGLPLHRAVEAAKVQLSAATAADLRFVRAPVALAVPLARADFERWIDPHLHAIDRVIDGVLERAGVAAAAVDRVFATGGSSFVPALRARLGARFGADRVVGGEELTSVASGLAARARARFA
jgi:hypothetical chaperone protein